MQKKKIRAIAYLVCVLIVLVMVIPQFTVMHKEEPIYAGAGVTQEKMLSDYFPKLKGTPGDTKVFILDSGKPGGTALVLGGTHGNEPSGYISALLFIEHAQLSQGRLIVVPRTNNSGFTHNDYTEGAPQKFSLNTPSGKRDFRYGSRATNTVDQWPDPDIYVHASSGQKLSGSETRNINRAYPGKADGTLTEQMAYGIVQLINKENVAMTIDLHEASPEYPVINAMVAHEKAMDVAAVAVIDLQAEGVKIALEPSPKGLRGLTHRELGDFTKTKAILMETANPSQGRLRGATNEELVVTGQDKMYVQAGKLGRLFVPFDEKGHSLDSRVARHVTAINVLFVDMSEFEPNKAVKFSKLPSYKEIVNKGVGSFLH